MTDRDNAKVMFVTASQLVVYDNLHTHPSHTHPVQIATGATNPTQLAVDEALCC
jgi:hypothetical protein